MNSIKIQFKMNEKGQFYLIAAIILIVIMVGLITVANEIRLSRQPAEFSELSSNFEREVARIIDRGIYQDKSDSEILADLDSFATNYTEFATTKEPTIGFLYIYARGKEIRVINFLQQGTTIVSSEGETGNITGGSALTLNKITFEIGDEKFVRDIYTRASTFQGINVETFQGEWVDVNVGGLPYRVQVGGDVTSGTLITECDAQGQCSVRFESASS